MGRNEDGVAFEGLSGFQMVCDVTRRRLGFRGDAP